jgi:hypothetical protein
MISIEVINVKVRSGWIGSEIAEDNSMTPRVEPLIPVLKKHAVSMPVIIIWVEHLRRLPEDCRHDTGASSRPRTATRIHQGKRRIYRDPDPLSHIS